MVKRYNCNINNEDYMEVNLELDKLVYFEVVFEGEYGETSHSVGLSKKQVEELINDLQRKLDE